ncbi:MAG: YncE family protein [Anaerolineae bacterium]|nr:YncE family protein [Anaerolineae bacterium]
MRFYQKLAVGITVLALVLVSISATLTVKAQGSNTKIILYGESAEGEITSAKDKLTPLFGFIGKKGDVISITITRKSGNLRPVGVVFDPTKPQNSQVIATVRLGADGRTASLTNFTLPSTGVFGIIVSREGVANGNTTGKFTISLKGPANAATPSNRPTATRPSTKPTLTKVPTKAPAKATATPEPDEPTEEPDAPSGEGVSSITVGQLPTFATWSGSNLYISNQGDGTISVLDADGNVTGTIKVGGVPFAMAWDGARLWVADLGTADTPGDSVSVFDAKGKKVGTFKVGSQPFSLSYDADNERMWIALYGENKIVAVDAQGEVVTSVDTDTNPNTVLWTGDRLFATLAGNQDNIGSSVIAVDTDGNITGTFKVGKSPADLAWDKSGKTLYVANYDDGTITALNSAGKVTGTFKVGQNPSALAWDGSHLWVTLGGDKSVVALDKKGKQLAKVSLDSTPNGVTFDGTYIWVANQGTGDEPGSTVTKIDPSVVIQE